jgi:hypothetical protein
MLITFMLVSTSVHTGVGYTNNHGPFPTKESAELYASQNQRLLRFQRHIVVELFSPDNLIKTLTWQTDPSGPVGNFKQVMHVIVAHCGKSIDDIETVYVGPYPSSRQAGRYADLMKTLTEVRSEIVEEIFAPRGVIKTLTFESPG